MKDRAKLPCYVVETLLPLYSEQLTDEETAKDVDYHLENCPSCRDLYEDLLREQKKTESVREQNTKKKNPFSKWRKRVIWQRILFFLFGVILCAGIFYAAFIGVVAYNSEDIDISYTTAHADGTYEVTFLIKSPEGTVLNTSHKDGDYSKVHLYKVFKMPFDDLGDHPNQMQMGFSQTTDFTNKDTITFVCKDKEITYKLSDLIEESN